MRRMKVRLRRLGGSVKDLLWPMARSCLLCGRATRQKSLCEDCHAALETQRLSPVDACDSRDVDADGALFVYAYAGAARHLVHRLKFDALEEAGAVLGWSLAAALRDRHIRPDVITWVPMPPRRRRQRGIDHGRCLAESVGEAMAAPCEALLRRSDEPVREQHTLSREERLVNACHAFRPLRDAPGLGGRTVLLIDDVCTTGATASSCVQALRELHPEKVIVAAVCRTQYALRS